MYGSVFGWLAIRGCCFQTHFGRTPLLVHSYFRNLILHQAVSCFTCVPFTTCCDIPLRIITYIRSSPLCHAQYDMEVPSTEKKKRHNDVCISFV